MSNLYKLLAQVEDVNHRQELIRMYDKEFSELKQRKMKLILEQEFTLGNLGKTCDNMKILIKNNALRIKEKLAQEHNNGWMFITVNPKPGVPFKEFYKKMVKLAERKMWVQTSYAFEQRSATEAEAGKGFHVHMLCKRNLNYKPTHCKRNIKTGCKKIVGSTENNALLNIQIIGDEYANDKLEYFTGIKKGTGKEEKQLIDKYWRKAIGIQDVYEHKKEN